MRLVSTFLIGTAFFFAAVLPARAEAPKTVFEYAVESWALGTVKLSVPLHYRDGKLLAFPARITELVRATRGNPQNLMYIHEVWESDDKPFFERGDVFFAPIKLLPQYSYWRDNLPLTRRHQAAGGRRYIFRGDDIPEAKRILTAYTEAVALGSKEGDRRALLVVLEALSSKNAVLRQDAVAYLAKTDGLAERFPKNGAAAFKAFVLSDAPESERVAVTAIAGEKKLAALVGELRSLADRDDRVGAAAVVSLKQLGKPLGKQEILDRTKGQTAELRAAAYGGLAGMVDADEAVRGLFSKVLASDESEGVRKAAIDALSGTHSTVVVPILVAAMKRLDGASSAAAEALGVIGGTEAVDALKSALIAGPDAATIGVISALNSTPGCTDCSTFLLRQNREHADEDLRKMIAIRMELPLPHEH